jgi:hypothetical protein
MSTEVQVLRTAYDTLVGQVRELEMARNRALRTLREACRHLRLVEFDAHPPLRICADCGAEERGWSCDYQVLVIPGDTWLAPHKAERSIVLRTSDSAVFYRHRMLGPVYKVGQSHPNFQLRGPRTYTQLTEVTE